MVDKKSGTDTKVIKYEIKNNASRRVYHVYNYNSVDVIYNTDKLYNVLAQEIGLDLRRLERTTKNKKSDDSTPSFPDSFKEYFCENSRGFYLLSIITRDCHEKGEDVVAYQVLNTFYECACLWQLVEARNSIEVGDDGDGKSNKFLSARMHKGHLTFDLARICAKLGWTWHRRYFLALTLAEDALSHFFHVQHGSEFCRLLQQNAKSFPEFDEAVLRKKRVPSDGKNIDLGYLKYLVSPAAEELWQMPDREDRKGYVDPVKLVKKLEFRIARFWRRTGLCQTLRTEFGWSLPDVMAFVVQIANRVFVQKSEKGPIKPLGAYHDDLSSIWFADVQNWKRVGWGAAWLGFPEWVAGQAGLFEVLPCPIAHNEVFSAPFNAAYYGYLCHSLIATDRQVRDERAPGGEKKSKEENRGNNRKGLLFEELAAYLCTATPGVRVLRNARSGAGELDLIGYVSPESSFLHPVTGNHFLGECKWQLRSTAVDVIDAMAARARRMQTDSVIVFSREGLSGEGKGENAERLIHAEAMGGISFAPLSDAELAVKHAAKVFKTRVDAGVRNPNRITLSSIRGLVRFRFPKLLRESFDKHRFGFYGSNKIEQ